MINKIDGFEKRWGWGLSVALFHGHQEGKLLTSISDLISGRPLSRDQHGDHQLRLVAGQRDGHGVRLDSLRAQT